MYTGIRETSLYYLTIEEFLPKRQHLLMKECGLLVESGLEPWTGIRKTCG